MEALQPSFPYHLDSSVDSERCGFSDFWNAQNAGSGMDFGNQNLGGGWPLVLRSETLAAGLLGFSNVGNKHMLFIKKIKTIRTPKEGLRSSVQPRGPKKALKIGFVKSV